MSAIKDLINHCLLDADALHMVDLMNQAKRADVELARLQKIEQAARKAVQNRKFPHHKEAMKELAAALETEQA